MLRRFASRTADDKAWVWLIRKDRPAREVSIRDVATGDHFYGAPELGLEELLARTEGGASELLAAIDRGVDPNSRADGLWALVWLLAVRTRAVRDALRSLGEDGVRAIADWINSPRSTPQLRAEMDKAMDDVLKLRGTGMSRSERRQFKKRARKEGLPSEVLRSAREAMPAFKAGFSLEEAASDAHVSGLLKLLQAASRTGRWHPSNWELIKFEPGRLVLGDSGPFLVRERVPRSVLRASDGYDAIYFPISHSAALVGHSGHRAFLDASSINSSSAALAHDSVFAAARTPEVEALAPIIGTCPLLLSDEEARSILREVLHGDSG